MSTDILDALPAYPDELPPPPPPRRRGFPLHPGFWWGIAWCLGALLLTQLLGPLVIVVPFAIYMAITMPGAQPDNLMQGPEMGAMMGVALCFAHFLLIVLSLLLLRVVVGKEWTREVAIRRPAWQHVVLVILLAPGFAIFANGVVYLITEVFAFPTTKNFAGTIAFVLAVVSALATTWLVWAFITLVSGRGWEWRLLGPKASLWSFTLSVMTLALFLGQAALFFKLHLAWTSALNVPQGQDGFMEKLMKQFNEWPLPLGVFVIAVMPGLSEELFCRAFLGRGMVGKNGYWWGVLFTSFLFGALHVEPVQGTMAACVGVLLHYVYLTTRSLLPAMLLHFLNNSLAVILARTPELQRLETDLGDLPATPLFVLLAAGLGLVAAVGYALYQSRARLVTLGGATPWQPAFPGVAWPPADSATVVHVPGLSLVSVLAVLAALGGFVAAAYGLFVAIT